MDSTQPDKPAPGTKTATPRPWEHDPARRPSAEPPQAAPLEDEPSIEEPGYGHGV